MELIRLSNNIFMQPEPFKLKSILLKFSEDQLEQQFLLFYERDTRVSIRNGFLLAFTCWTAGIGLIYLIIPEHILKLSIAIIIVLYPYFVFVIYATYRDQYLGKYQLMGAISNGLAGLLGIYVISFFPNSEYTTLIFLIIVQFFGSYIIRLRFLHILNATLFYVLIFQLYLAFFANIDKANLIALSFFLWVSEICVLFTGYISEHTSRVVFIQQKTIQEQKDRIQNEQEKSENLLLNILPESIAQRLKNKDSVIADSFENISVLFADLVGFTSLSARLSPEEIVTLLNDIFSRFDDWVDSYGLEKIKTIGDSYMVVGGLPVPQMDHVPKMALLALNMQQEVSRLNSQLNHYLSLRIGIHIGPVVAGVIGTKKFSYDVWGDTVNTASRLESHGVDGQIQVSKDMYEVLKDDFSFEERGLVNLKGKGELPTYILVGEK